MEISTSFDAGRLTVYISGELDHHEAHCAMLRIDELLDEYMPRDRALNLAGLRFMDSSGIALILRAEKKMRELDGSLRISGVGEQPLRVLRAAGTDKRIPIDSE